jgi:dTDP-4-dehydrorhamnose reductase
MKIVLLGRNGQLGWEFQQLLPALGELVAWGREDLDVSDVLTVQNTLAEVKPDLIINSTAYTEVDRAESEPDLALKINGLAPGVMAETARKLGAVFIHYSTDYVFDGKSSRPYIETDPPGPLNTYGRSKLLGEENVQQAGDAYLILRTSWVYSLRGNSFVNKVLGWSRKNRILRIVSDQVSSPTWTRALAEITCRAIQSNPLGDFRDRRGVYNLSGAGFTSRCEWARRILAHDPKRTEQLVQAIEPASSAEFPTPAVRPLFSALDCTKFRETFHLRLPGWEDSLRVAMAA